jgi:hypothetical protein
VDTSTTNSSSLNSTQSVNPEINIASADALPSTGATDAGEPTLTMEAAINSLELITQTKMKCGELMRAIAPDFADRLYQWFGNHAIQFNFDAPAGARWYDEDTFVVVCRRSIGEEQFTKRPKWERVEIKFTRAQLEALPAAPPIDYTA